MSKPSEIENVLNEILQKVKSNDVSEEMKNILVHLSTINNIENEGKTIPPVEDKELYMKYYTMGYYIYSMINK